MKTKIILPVAVSLLCAACSPKTEKQIANEHGGHGNDEYHIVPHIAHFAKHTVQY